MRPIGIPLLSFAAGMPALVLCGALFAGEVRSQVAPPAPEQKPITVTLASKRTSLLAFQQLELTLTVQNSGTVAIPALERTMLAGPKTVVAAPPPDVDDQRRGAWAEMIGEPPSGSIGPIHPGESFTLPIRVVLPESLTATGMPIHLQWVGKIGPLAGERSNELTVVIQNGNYPIATVDTTDGMIVLELWADKAPNHVANLVELAQKGFYDGLIFHRCMRNFMIQGGCPKGDGTGNPGYMIPGEFNDTEFKKGILGMARGPENDTAGSQFFICVADYPSLNKQYTAFGRVLEGQDVADKISMLPTKNDRPLTDVKIRRLTVELPKGYQKPALVTAGAQSK